MKYFLVLLSLLIIPLASGNSCDKSINQHIDCKRAKPSTLSDITQLVLAFQRKDYVLVTIKALEIYEDVAQNEEPPLVRIILCVVKSGLYIAHPIYLEIYPEKKPPDISTNAELLVDTVNTVVQNDLVKSVADTFIQSEDPMFNNVLNFLF